MANKYKNPRYKRTSGGSVLTCKKKIRFTSMQGAEKAVIRILNKSGKLMRPYYCGMCNGYHLTSGVK